MITLYLARHGQTEENIRQILQGHMPGHLTEEGIRQAHELKDRLKDIHFDAIISSDLERALVTAKIICSSHDCVLSTEKLLRERDWGSITGRFAPEVRDIGFPSDTETVEDMYKRASVLLDKLLEDYDNKTVLAISHGLFIRVICGFLENKMIREIPPLPNCGFIRLEISNESLKDILSPGDDVEATN